MLQVISYIRPIRLLGNSAKNIGGIYPKANTNSFERLDVVDVTKNNREHINDMVKDMYVVEEINIDGIVIWQDVTGRIYETCPGCEKPKPIYNSLVEYLESV